jgi:hypothetical protein
MTNRNYRMYGMVNYQLSGIQKGIQFGHAVVEYANDHFHDEEYQQWAKNDKTFIILNGGTTNNTRLKEGTLNLYLTEMIEQGIPVGEFSEPDLGDQLTAFVFLVDDRVFDKEAWPDFDGPEMIGPYYEWKMKFAETEKEADRIIWLRSFLKNFKLA